MTDHPRRDPAELLDQRVCGRCKLLKPLTEFHVRYRETGERLTWCRTCMAGAKREWYVRNRDHQKERVKLNNGATTRRNQDLAWQFLAQHPCVDCGETDPVVLQFDHIGAKRTEVSTMLQAGSTWPRIELEIQNCVVRCGNCHRRKTARERGYDVAKRGNFELGGSDELGAPHN